MELKNDFVVDRPVSETWKILTNLELIAPCLPGARLEEVEGDEYRGSVSVKVGPITGKYKGKASFVEQDEANHVAKLKAEGRDPRQGNANALITAAMVPAGGDGNQTRVDLTTDLGLSGKIASFARGNLEDVSRRLLNQFADNLEAMLAEKGTSDVGAGAAAMASPSGTAGAEPADAAALPGETVAAPDSATAGAATVGEGSAPTAAAGITEPGGSDRAPSPPPSEQAVPSAATAAPPGAATTTTPQPTVRKIQSAEAKPVDLLAVSGADSLAKKLGPVVGVVVLVLLVRWLLRRRG